MAVTYKWNTGWRQNWTSAGMATSTKFNDNAVGDTTTYEGSASNSEVTLTVICDLGAAAVVSRIQIKAMGSTGNSTAPYGEWAASNDGSTWTTLKTLTAGQIGEATWSALDSNTLGGTSGTAYRYWRFTMDGGVDSDDNSQAYCSDFRFTVPPTRRRASAAWITT